ncbi:MAG: biotin/lipoyl-containing protein [Pseudomonadota bacterium]
MYGFKRRHRINRDLVRELVELLEEHGLSELEYGTAGWNIRVARGGGKTTKRKTPAPGRESATDSLADHPGAVTSPLVGTSYLSSEPGAPNFVNVGDEVKEGQTLLLVEAMKTFNQIRAPRNGKVTQILVQNGQHIEYGEVLMVLE